MSYRDTERLIRHLITEQIPSLKVDHLINIQPTGEWGSWLAEPPSSIKPQLLKRLCSLGFLYTFHNVCFVYIWQQKSNFLDNKSVENINPIWNVCKTAQQLLSLHDVYHICRHQWFGLHYTCKSIVCPKELWHERSYCRVSHHIIFNLFSELFCDMPCMNESRYKPSYKYTMWNFAFHLIFLCLFHLQADTEI